MKKHLATLRHAIEAGFNMVSTFQLMLLPGSEMCAKTEREKYGMVTRFRVFPRCYGAYDVSGEPVVAAEIEEVCVGLKTLSFDDYLFCRKLHLIIALFYNDGIFGALLKYLRASGFSVFRWLELINEAVPPRELEGFFGGFQRDTRDELWESRADLEAFLRKPGNIERYIAGEIGNNLLFTYKTRGITDHIGDLAELARRATVALLTEKKAVSPAALAFVEDALLYQVCRATDLFDKFDRNPTVALRYDIEAYENDRQPRPIEDYRLDPPGEFRFVLTEQQRELVTRYLGVFGNTPWGIGRMMTKVYVKRLLRRAQPTLPSRGIRRTAVRVRPQPEDPMGATVGGTRQA